MVGAAALLLIIAGVVMFMLVRHQEFWDNTVAAIGDSVTAYEVNKRTWTDGGCGGGG